MSWATSTPTPTPAISPVTFIAGAVSGNCNAACENTLGSTCVKAAFPQTAESIVEAFYLMGLDQVRGENCTAEERCDMGEVPIIGLGGEVDYERCYYCNEATGGGGGVGGAGPEWYGENSCETARGNAIRLCPCASVPPSPPPAPITAAASVGDDPIFVGADGLAYEVHAAHERALLRRDARGCKQCLPALTGARRERRIVQPAVHATPLPQCGIPRRPSRLSWSRHHGDGAGFDAPFPVRCAGRSRVDARDGRG